MRQVVRIQHGLHRIDPGLQLQGRFGRRAAIHKGLNPRHGSGIGRARRAHDPVLKGSELRGLAQHVLHGLLQPHTQRGQHDLCAVGLRFGALQTLALACGHPA